MTQQWSNGAQAEFLQHRSGQALEELVAFCTIEPNAVIIGECYRPALGLDARHMHNLPDVNDVDDIPFTDDMYEVLVHGPVLRELSQLRISADSTARARSQ
jgi:hypothetical protein